jgi:pimeloyl-ACP methyl ester carboxylesterase
MAAPRVLFLPGLLEDADAFFYQVERIRPFKACVVADLTRADTIAGLATEALKQAGDGPFALAGHSMGGYVALEILRQAPQRVERLALLNTNARADTPEATENRKRLMALAEKDFPAVIRALMPKLLLEESQHEVEMTGTIMEMALASGKEAFARQQRAIIGRIDSRPHLAAIRCPTLVVAARGDAIMPMEVSEELARGIPGARLHVVEESGHIPTLEQPVEMTRVLMEWLELDPNHNPGEAQ